MAQKNIVVVGRVSDILAPSLTGHLNGLSLPRAGVAGLTSALLLSRDPNYSITVAAKHMPGDYDIEYASPWAGANYMPTSVGGTRAAEWDKNTWAPFEDLARHHPEAGVHFQSKTSPPGQAKCLQNRSTANVGRHQDLQSEEGRRHRVCILLRQLVLSQSVVGDGGSRCWCSPPHTCLWTDTYVSSSTNCLGAS